MDEYLEITTEQANILRKDVQLYWSRLDGVGVDWTPWEPHSFDPEFFRGDNSFEFVDVPWVKRAIKVKSE